MAILADLEKVIVQPTDGLIVRIEENARRTSGDIANLLMALARTVDIQSRRIAALERRIGSLETINERY